MCGENVVCRTGRVKKCGEKITQEEEVSLSSSRESKKERALLIFRSKTGFRAALLQRRKRDFSISKT